MERIRKEGFKLGKVENFMLGLWSVAGKKPLTISFHVSRGVIHFLSATDTRLANRLNGLGDTFDDDEGEGNTPISSSKFNPKQPRQDYFG